MSVEASRNVVLPSLALVEIWLSTGQRDTLKWSWWLVAMASEAKIK